MVACFAADILKVYRGEITDTLIGRAVRYRCLKVAKIGVCFMAVTRRYYVGILYVAQRLMKLGVGVAKRLSGLMKPC